MNSTANVSKGREITVQTAQILQDVGTNAAKMDETFRTIAEASSNQVIAIEQIKSGLDQVSAVVQTNAATAEENSATSREMSAQAAVLHQQVEKFKLSKEVEQGGGLHCSANRYFRRRG